MRKPPKESLVETQPSPEEPSQTVANIITSIIGAAITACVGLVLGNLRVDAMVGLGEYELFVEKERMKMPRYKTRRTRPVDGC